MEANAFKPQDKKDVLELFQMYLSLHNAYHDHKELMAYSATALYLGGISTFLLSGREFWVDRTILYIGVLILFTIFACLLTFFFVRWQFRQRCFAATIMAACVNLTNKWLPTPTVVADLTPVPFGVSEEFHVPQVLVKEFEQAKKIIQKNVKCPQRLTHGAVILWTLLAVFTILVTWLQAQCYL